MHSGLLKHAPPEEARVAGAYCDTVGRQFWRPCESKPFELNTAPQALIEACLRRSNTGSSLTELALRDAS